MTLSCLFDRFLVDGDVLIGMWPQDPRWSWVNKEPEYDGQVLDFYNRPIGRSLEPYLDLIPEGCGIREVDQTLLRRSVNFEKHVANFCNLEDTISNLMGFYLMYGDEILCESLAGPVIRGTREPGVDTREHYRQKGYATVTCAYLIDACEKAGLQTWWNCNKTNIASTALARKLGYREEKLYRLCGWFRKG
jgi:RimJ/RimL family protein N-acetyltransferase